MTVRRFHHKQSKLEQLQKRLTTLQAQVRAEDRNNNAKRQRIIGEIVENWLNTEESFVGNVNLGTFREEFYRVLDRTLKDNWQRELFGLELNLDERGKETHMLIIQGRILEKWVEWGKVSKQDFTEGLGQYLKRNIDRELFGLPLLGDSSNTVYDDEILDSFELSKQKTRQKLILMGRMLVKWVEQGKISQAQYQSGLDGFIKVDSDRRLFGLGTLPKVKKEKAQQTDNAAAPSKQQIITPVSQQELVTRKSELENKVSPIQLPPAKKLRSKAASEDQFHTW
ncbi:MAG: hypothetical protein KME49_22575 [Brasilonema octagenarum HA4186-MV1]|jgi:hypothetical protein|nr:hypothetical protein [Brasilonema octagenarum HA4186-MV1]